MVKIQRDFFPGDKWLYLKIYTGIKTGESILLDLLYPFANNLIRKKIIEKWFFIRYSDPDFHIRIRFLCKNVHDINYIIISLNRKLKQLCEDHFVFNISIEKYSRELERYGDLNMEFSESIFHLDSECVCSILKKIQNLDSNYRWMIAFRLIDELLNSFKLDLIKKQEYIDSLDLSYKAEYGYNTHNQKQLNSLYRMNRDRINKILSSGYEDLVSIDKIIDMRSKRLTVLGNNNPHVAEVNVKGIIHMMMNRLFMNQNRTHELLIYNFLNRYYLSEIAKLNAVKRNHDK